MHRIGMRLLLVLLIAAALMGSASGRSAQVHAVAGVDTDGDGLSDALEQALLVQFAPRFMVAAEDCSGIPAEFLAGSKNPVLAAEDGTIYGQAFPARDSTEAHPSVEMHFYHLWRRDCGRHGHALDTEHVAVLIRGSQAANGAEIWKAQTWYAAAHENTVCDVSHMTRASTIGAEDRGARVWISPGKHASYLDDRLCQRGCGADRCERMQPLKPGRIINLGEPGHPMNGSLFIASDRWPLGGKMKTSNFPTEALARLDKLPETDIAWANPGRHPAQGIIAISSSTEAALAHSGGSTTSAISVAGDSTGNALSSATDATGGALGKSYHKTLHALGSSARHVGKALHPAAKPDQPE